MQGNKCKEMRRGAEKVAFLFADQCDVVLAPKKVVAAVALRVDHWRAPL